MFTVGHSNQSIESFLALLQAHGVARIADVRAFPASRRWPHFGREALSTSLAAAGIDYQWLPALGGRRAKVREASPHVAWTVPAFRNYADYMESAEFAAALERLLALDAEAPTAILCAEARWWQCHRRLISDRLVVEGHVVRHIESPRRASEHHLPDFARVEKGRLIYDGGVLPRTEGS